MINVSCAIIVNDLNEVLVTQRSSSMPLPLKWEFPGGKVELDETEEESLVREIKEEVNIDIVIIGALTSNIHSYGEKKIRLIPFICKISSGEILLEEHLAYKWQPPENLLDLDWAEADIPIVKDYLNNLDVI